MDEKNLFCLQNKAMLKRSVLFMTNTKENFTVMPISN